MGIAAVTTLMGLAMLLVAIVLALPVPSIGAVVMGAVLLTVSVGLGLAGWRMLPKKPLQNTLQRVETEMADAKEQLT